MNDVRWEGLTHEEIYSRVHQGPGRVASADAEAAWGTVESTIRTVDDQLSRTVKQIGVDWQGSAADTVRGGMTVMSNWALDAAGDALLTREGVDARPTRQPTSAPPCRRRARRRWTRPSSRGSAHGLRAPDGRRRRPRDSIAADRARAVDLMTRYTSDS